MKKSEVKRKKKMRILIATLGVAALIVGGLTFAWYTSQDSVVNTFKASGNFKTTIVENFTPPSNWQPGTTTDKVVQITNTGTVDAYTRVELVPSLTYYVAEGDAVDAANYSADATYVPASKEAIDKLAASDGYVAITSTTPLEGNLAPLSGKLTVPANVTLYAKVSEGESKTADAVVENGYNYEFVGYLTDPTDETKVYAVTVTDPTYGNDPAGSTGDVTHAVNNALSITIQPTTKKEYDYTTADGQAAINKMVTLNFRAADGSDAAAPNDADWKAVPVSNGEMTTTYYYYKHVLKSGESTTALLNSVKFNETFTDTIYDAQFDLNVVNISTQAIYDAADGTYPTTVSGVATGLEDSAFTAAGIPLDKVDTVNADGSTTANP